MAKVRTPASRLLPSEPVTIGPDGAPLPGGENSVKEAIAAAKRPRFTKPKKYRASIFQSVGGDLPAEFSRTILELESILGMPIWTLIQNKGSNEWSEIGFATFKGFQRLRAEMPPGKPIGLLIDSPGGDPHHAFRIARLLQRRSENRLFVVIPQFAKSAAALIALAARHLLLSRDAELGPLDVQMFDIEREDWGSALNAVQSIERLNAVALKAVDQAMILLVQRTGKRTDVLLPHILEYAATMLRPLLDKIDTVDFTRKSRELKVAEEYALRLMRPNYQFMTARRIARQLVEKYPTHGFVIDSDEVTANEKIIPAGETFGLGLNLFRCASKRMEQLERKLEKLIPHLDDHTIIGRIREAKS